VNAAGPDRVSGGQWDATYAREYFRAVTSEGTLVWLFRDAGRDRWYLHGWWD
jgi:protein ImuB